MQNFRGILKLENNQLLSSIFFIANVLSNKMQLIFEQML